MIEVGIQQAYEQLLQRRASERSAPLVSLDLVRELAEARSIRQDQVAVLDEILSHPVTRNEFYFLREVAQSKVRTGWSGFPLWAAAAAAVVLSLGVSAYFWTTRIHEPEPMRGAASQIALVAPAPNGRLAGQTNFIWRSAAGASSYTLELLDAEGNVVWRTVGADTSAMLPASVPRSAGARYTWIVRASLGDGTTSLSAPRAVIGQP